MTEISVVGKFRLLHNPSSSPDSPNNRTELVPVISEDDYLRAYNKGELSQFTVAYDPLNSENPPTKPFQFPLPQFGRITMAERFPKIEDLDLGDSVSHRFLVSCL